MSATFYTPDTLGINYAWMDKHTGLQTPNSEVFAFVFGSNYNAAIVERDLKDMASLGIRKTRVWMQVEALADYSNGTFTLNNSYLANADDFLTRAAKYGITCMVVLGDGGEISLPVNGDGKLHWDLTLTASGIQTMVNLYVSVVQYLLKGHSNIFAWDMINEPYGTVNGFTPIAAQQGATIASTHAYLKTVYAALKAVTQLPVFFSEYDEPTSVGRFATFSDPVFRATYFDDCCDVYSIHVFRRTAAEMFDYTNITKKPKWLSEFGCTNFNDPSGSNHGGYVGNLELFQQGINAGVVRQMCARAYAQGFTLIMPWSWVDNPGVVVHNVDGSHTIKDLGYWIASQLLPRAIR